MVSRFVIFFCLIILAPVTLLAETASSRTGFVDGPVWFSKDKIKDGQNIKIHTAIFNGEDNDIKVSLNFIDADVLLSKKEISIKASETRTISIDWKVSTGAHNIFAEITDVQKNNQKIIIDRNKTKEVKFQITKDIQLDLAKATIVKEFGNFVNLKDNENLKSVDSWFKMNFKKSEEFREEMYSKLTISKENVSEKKEKNKDSKSATKISILIHLILLIVFCFIFSFSVVFYILTVIVFYFIARIIFRFLKRLFRKKYDE